MQVSFSFTYTQKIKGGPEKRERGGKTMFYTPVQNLERKDCFFQFLGLLTALVRMGLVEKDNLSP